MITLKTLPQATAQQVYDQAKEHLLKQNAKSMTDGSGTLEGCLYRGPNGLKCAAGCLIADEEYKIDMEGRSWSSLVQDGYVPDYLKNLISELQTMHDQNMPSLWPTELELLAQRHNLNP